MKFLKLQILTTLCCLLAAFSAQAQEKIGSNPTTIDANRNLEVEATAGQKVYISQDEGITFIENTPLAAETDSILMTNAATGQVNKMSLSRLSSIVGGGGGAGGGDCFVPDVSGSYVAPIIVGNTTNGPANVIDLSGMAVGECFWDWPLGLYGIFWKAVGVPHTGYTLSSFCIKETVHRSGFASTSNTPSQYLAIDGAVGGLTDNLAIAIPSLGWGSFNGTKIGIICRRY